MWSKDLVPLGLYNKLTLVLLLHLSSDLPTIHKSTYKIANDQANKNGMKYNHTSGFQPVQERVCYDTKFYSLNVAYRSR